MQVMQVEHPLLGTGEVTGVRELGWVPDMQVGQTVALMCERVREDAQDVGFVAHAQSVLQGDWTRAWGHVKGVVKFHRDEELGGGVSGVVGEGVAGDTVEFIIRPREMAKFVERGQACGDCDDFSMYLACLLETVGIPCAFVTVAADERAPNQYSHVYVRAYPPGEDAIALDASHGEYPGWEVPNYFGKLREWPVRGDGFSGLLMLIGAAAGAVYLYKEFVAA
jgi:Transglutaminase-like superfamily